MQKPLAKFESDFFFRATRDYVLLMDLFRWSAECAKKELGAKSLHDLDFVLHERISKNCVLSVFEGEEVTLDSAAGILAFAVGEKRYTAFLEETDRELTKRVEFDEQKIFDATELGGDGALTLKKNVGYPPIEMLISMTKQLHVKLFPEAKGKWVATRLQLDEELPESFQSLSLKNVHNFHFKLTKNRIALNGKPVGFSFFSLA